jgi:DNA-binding transcriptional MerR regulator
MIEDGVLHISEAAAELSCTPQHLRILEWEGRIPPARRDFSGRIYTPSDIALLRNMGVGQRPRKLKRAEEVLEGAR